MTSTGRVCFALVLGPWLLTFCGGRTVLDEGSGNPPAGGQGEATGGGAPDAGPAPDGGGGEAAYTGVVVATLQGSATTPAYGVFADFQPGPPFGVGACPGAESCCCGQGVPLPLPVQPPDAATVTLVSGEGGGTLATLTPSASTLQGTWYLGAAWAARPGDYPLTTSQPWSPGDALSVVAAGGVVHPFSGTLQTGAPLSGVTPPIGPSPLAVDRTQPLQVSWAPEGKADESVMLMLQQFTSEGTVTCWCTAPDTASEVTVAPALLGGFGTEQLSALLRLERLITSTTSSDDATVYLIGEVAQTAPVSFH